MSLKLEGILSYIDKYNRLKVVFIDDIDPTDKTRQKLINSCRSPFKPWDNTEMTITVKNKNISDCTDIMAMIGLRVIIHVKLHAYSFLSKLEKNNGEKVKGVQLILLDIERA